LEDVTFNLSDGEIMGLAGESGCGKTTLGFSLIYLSERMRYIKGHVRLNSQEVPIWDNKKMDKIRYEDISIIPQYAMSAMNPTKKIGKMVKDLIQARGLEYSKVEPEFIRRIHLAKLSDDILKMYPIELSGGMKQRMVMVISTLLNPELLIADEITSALDVSTQKAIAEMLVDFRNRQFLNSMIVITHDISILYQIADSIMVMYAGQLSEKGPRDTIIREPLHPYTKLLISSLPTIGIKYEEDQLSGIPGKPPLLLNPPEGCRFRDRCPLAYAKCKEVPPFIEVAKDHYVACWKVAEK
jgi:peptide/nickel transport system ATP-binding protein